MAKEPTPPPPKERKHYPGYEYKITSGFATMNVLGKEGWEYVDNWAADSSVTTLDGIPRRGSDPFIIWRRELD